MKQFCLSLFCFCSHILSIDCLPTFHSLSCITSVVIHHVQLVIVSRCQQPQFDIEIGPEKPYTFTHIPLVLYIISLWARQRIKCFQNISPFSSHTRPYCVFTVFHQRDEPPKITHTHRGTHTYLQSHTDRLLTYVFCAVSFTSFINLNYNITTNT